MKFSDETLVAYLEGNLEDAEARAIEDAVADNEALENRLMGMDPFAPVVRQVFESVPTEMPELALPAPIPVRNSASPFRLLAVAASVAVLAVSTTFWATRPAELGWTAQAAIYQSLYVPDTIASLDNSAQTLDAQFAQAEGQLGRSLNREALETLPGLELKRAQVLSFKGKPLIQIVFADEQGQPFALCIIRQGAGAANKGVDQAVLSGLATANWSQDGYGYMLIGSSEETDLGNELDVLTGVFAS